MFDHAVENEHSASASEHHLSIDQCVDALVTNKCDAMNTIVLAHLSDSNSDADKFIREVRNAVSIDNIFVAGKGLDIELWSKQD
jgi:ribonuclease BN (tRNA processing enzyme)